MTLPDDCTFHFQILNEHGTGFWISSHRFLTANHLFDGLDDNKKEGRESFAMMGAYKTFRGCTLECQIVSYERGYSDSWDLAVVELKSEPPFRDVIDVVAVNWSDDRGTWCKRDDGIFTIFGFPLNGAGFLNWRVTGEHLRIVRKPERFTDLQYNVEVERIKAHSSKQPGLLQFGGLSGAPLFDEHVKQVVGVVVDHIRTHNEEIFKCVETARLAEWWAPLKSAVEAYRAGEEFLLKQRNWEEAKKRLGESRCYFETRAKVPAPRGLEKMIAIAEAQQLLDEKDWDGALERVAKWYVDTAAVFEGE